MSIRCKIETEKEDKNKHPYCQRFHSQDLITDSSYCLRNNSYDVSSENLVLDQVFIHQLLFLFILTSCLLGILLTL